VFEGRGAELGDDASNIARNRSEIRECILNTC
jgi:hypothetical protein